MQLPARVAPRHIRSVAQGPKQHIRPPCRVGSVAIHCQVLLCSLLRGKFHTLPWTATAPALPRCQGI